jgi:hypothetical protein
VRRGASWTVEYHLQLTVAAVPRPVRSSVVPSSSVLLSAPGRRPPSRRLPSGAAAGLQRSGIVAVIDTARTPPRRRSLVSGMRCPPSRFVVRDPAVQPSGVRPSGVRSPAFVVRGPPIRPVAVHPSSVQPLLSTRPVSSPLLSTPSVRSRPSPPKLRRWRGDQVEAAGQPSPQQPVEVPVAAATSGGWVASRGAWGQTALPRSCGGQSGVGGGPGRGWDGQRRPPLPLRDQAGQAGVRSRLWLALAPWAGSRPRRELAAAAAWLVSSGWVGDHGVWWSWRWPVRVATPLGVPAGMGCGPSAAQAGSGRSRLVVGSAVTWGDGWWACQDLNLGPHPYQGSAPGLVSPGWDLRPA